MTEIYKRFFIEASSLTLKQRHSSFFTSGFGFCEESRITQLCGEVSNTTYFSQSSSTTLRFKTDEAKVWEGFTATFTDSK